MRTDETLKYLRKRGADGVSTEELGEKFGFKHSGSASKIINQLRANGHTIEHDRERGVYVLTKEAPDTENSDAVDAELEEIVDGAVDASNDTEEDPGKNDASDDAIFYKASSKKDKILQYLIKAGKRGGNPAEISKYSGVGSKNVCFHIHALRKEGHKITTKEGRYFVRANHRNPQYNSGTQDLPVSEIPVTLLELLGDKRLVTDIHKLRREELPTYVDFLKKIIFYTKCALAMYETREMLETLTIGEGQ